MKKTNVLKSSPILQGAGIGNNIQKNKLNDKGMESESAYHVVKDQLIPEGNARQNLATFCQTYMEPTAVKLICETLDKNAIDKSLYTQTADIENRCIEIIADLWHRPEENEKRDDGDVDVPKGTSTIGSSEACMLGGMSMKYRWKKWAEMYKNTHPDFDINKKPNLIISSGYQVCWEKFEKYWDVELKTVPINKDHLSLDPNVLENYIDEYTIGVVAILGITYTGLYDDVKGIDEVLTNYNNEHTDRFSVQIHVDGASGGFYEPFIDPDYLWDFRLKNVISINGSGHKYGLVYPGIGWVVWRGSEYLPKELTFEVSYLGGTVRTAGINFSKSAAHIIAQYYNFIRFGREGYKKIHSATKSVAEYIEESIENITMDINGEDVQIFEILREQNSRNLHRLPLVCWKLSEKAESNISWDLKDVSDRMLMRGWQIPAYPLPDDLSDVMIQRIVCRADLSMDLAEILVNDIKSAVIKLNAAKKMNYASNALESISDEKLKPYGFTH